MTSPVAVTSSLHIIAVGLLCESAEVFGGPEIVGLVNDLDVPEVAGLAKSFFREMATAHLCRCVLTTRL